MALDKSSLIKKGRKPVKKDDEPYEFQKDADIIGFPDSLPKGEPGSKFMLEFQQAKAPSKTFKVLFSIVQWLVILGIVYVVLFGSPLKPVFEFGTFTPVEILFFGLSLAFLWVEKWKIGVIRPFNCIGCMAGWFCIAIAGFSHTPHWYLYGPAGVFVGSLFSLIKGKL